MLHEANATILANKCKPVHDIQDTSLDILIRHQAPDGLAVVKVNGPASPLRYFIGFDDGVTITPAAASGSGHVTADSPETPVSSISVGRKTHG